MEETNIKCVLCFLIIYDTYDNTKVCQWQRIISCNLLNVKIKLYQEPITRSVHLHSIRDPTYAQVELFLEMIFAWTSVSTAVCIWRKSKKWWLKQSPTSFFHFSQAFFLKHFFSFCIDFGHVLCGLQRRQTFAGNNSQSGYRLSLRLSTGDVRFRRWAPANLTLIHSL